MIPPPPTSRGAMKTRRHHNNKGYRAVKRGRCAEQLKRMAKMLGLHFAVGKTEDVMKFVATEIRPDGKPYGVTVEASSWDEARSICEREGWTLDGELMAVIPATETFGHKEADEMVAAMADAETATKQ